MAEVTMIRCDHCGQLVDPGSGCLLTLHGTLSRMNLGSGLATFDTPHLCSARCVMLVIQKALDELSNGGGHGDG